MERDQSDEETDKKPGSKARFFIARYFRYT